MATHDLTYQRCFNHSAREAVARCPECHRHFCRECVTEHDDRVVCTACLSVLAGNKAKGAGLSRIIRGFVCAISFLLLWFMFHLAGEGLLSLPDEFHEGSLWHANWWED